MKFILILGLLLSLNQNVFAADFTERHIFDATLTHQEAQALAQATGVSFRDLSSFEAKYEGQGFNFVISASNATGRPEDQRFKAVFHADLNKLGHYNLENIFELYTSPVDSHNLFHQLQLPVTESTYLDGDGQNYNVYKKSFEQDEFSVECKLYENTRRQEKQYNCHFRFE